MRLRAGLALVMFTAATGAAFAQAPHTTRIETRPYYGAVVTIEQGVRVYRPVPPTTHLIINPDGAASLGLDLGSGASVVPNAATQTTDLFVR